MGNKKMTRKQAIFRRNLVLIGLSLILALIVLISVFIATDFIKNSKKEESKNETSSNITSSVVSETKSSSSEPIQSITSNSNTSDSNTALLDKSYSKLLLVNGSNPLPENYDYEGNLITIPNSYLKGWRNQVDKDIWVYLKAMIDDARSEGVDIGVLSPYRSYASQKELFEAQVNRELAKGLDRTSAEKEASTVVARPGTSEHHTGLAIDFNSVEDSFANTPAYKWLTENAENYGFIMRYSGEKEPITGVIHESWHWRFVGINHAKEINRLGMCLEEYIEYINK